MNVLLRNWLLPIKDCIISKIQGALVCSLCFTFQLSRAQIANYVQNGGFEECGNCGNYIGGTLSAKYWTSFDSTGSPYGMFSELPPGGQIPQIGFTWQWPKSGHNYILTTIYFPNNISSSSLGYPRNKLKQKLQAGKTYCVKFYCNISDPSTYGIDGIGAYFGDDGTDTITKVSTPLSYLTPQIKNPTGNIITDTLKWTLITGTFVAVGTEKYVALGNFKSNASMDTLMINPTNLPTIFTDVSFDDVSCIDLDLPAYAGLDYYLIAGDSTFLGRTPDVGINEACTWYQSPNLSVPIDTVAGLYVKPAITTTYVVRQEICGLVKWDTVIVFASALSIQSTELALQNLKLYPVPARNELNLEWSSEVLQKQFTRAEIVTSLGQTFPQELFYDKGLTTIQIANLPEGIYTLRFTGNRVPGIEKRFVINR